jgi:general secretion pathway protein G
MSMVTVGELSARIRLYWGDARNLAQRVLSRRGLPIFEVLTSLVILSMFYVCCVGGVFQGEMSPRAANENRMIALKMAVLSYKWANNTFPSGLGELVCEGRDKRSCISVTTPDLLLDVWGAPYIYRYRPGAKEFALTSLGADKKEGGRGADADVTVSGP